MRKILFILYVEDQDKSTNFYSNVLAQQPNLYVPGMTEYLLSPETALGLMPIHGIKKLLAETLPDPALAKGIPRSEFYWIVKNATEYHCRALVHGAKELSPLQERSWGDCVAYSLDPDGHVLAFAEQSKSPS
ncbi:MAG: glyoxalase [Planctomycetota bacterium]